jgi:hypothetical protein
MKGTLEFNLPDEWPQHLRAVKADDAYSILWNLMNTPDVMKRLLNLTSEDELRRELYEIYYEGGVNIDQEYA